MSYSLVFRLSEKIDSTVKERFDASRNSILNFEQNSNSKKFKFNKT